MAPKNAEALDAVARQGFSNGAFEDSDEEAESVVEEFYPETQWGSVTDGSVMPSAGATPANTLADKLEARVRRTAAVVLDDPAMTRGDGHVSDVTY